MGKGAKREVYDFLLSMDYGVCHGPVEGMVIEMNVSAANTVTVPAGLGGSEPVTVVQAGTGQTSIVAGAGVSILSADGALKLRAQYSSATLIPKTEPRGHGLPPEGIQAAIFRQTTLEGRDHVPDHVFRRIVHEDAGENDPIPNAVIPGVV